eukprot:4557489-Prymnesium_polylepis.1
MGLGCGVGRDAALAPSRGSRVAAPGLPLLAKAVPQRERAQARDGMLSLMCTHVGLDSGGIPEAGREA